MCSDERKIQRYVVFGGMANEQAGGWDDFLASFSDLDEAKTFASAWLKTGDKANDWYHIIDLTTGENIESEVRK